MGICVYMPQYMKESIMPMLEGEKTSNDFESIRGAGHLSTIKGKTVLLKWA
ncbi:hypothetical protein EDD76_103304 [Kineothrix alysoides]|uniref:Uncharacterized protein n=1 Tax=Kineothrix alysoides TaxID=1469948 RepID=A0A4R1R3S8_9FIRM|nr:hypothetical protein EDD76_103304 [Kineothrix alysoides]